MAKYVYPAIVTPEKGGYSFRFPDVDCTASGRTLTDGMERAAQALARALYEVERAGQPAPAASPIRGLPTPGESFATLVLCDTKLLWQTR